MILCDDRTGSKELLPLLQHIGVPCELSRLAYGDFCFGGNGPKGPITVGVERKTLQDMLCCIEDSRYSAHQRPGMMKLYDKSYLILEGMWAPGNGNGMDGVLFQGYRNGQSWGPLKTTSSRRTMYSKLYRYLMSVALSGVIITHSNHPFHTAYNVTEMFHYFSKAWNSHTSLIEVQKLAIPTLNGRPPLVRRWASELTDVGVVRSVEAERRFKNGLDLANSTETDWMSLSGIGVVTAQRIVREIRGWK